MHGDDPNTRVAATLAEMNVLWERVAETIRQCQLTRSYMMEVRANTQREIAEARKSAETFNSR